MTIVRVSLPRLRRRLEQLGATGRDPQGGLTRLPFAPSHTEAVRLTAQMMAEAGLEVGVDEFGILVGRFPGADEVPSILTGSHLDTVPQGGMFDGALGVIAGTECAQALREAGRPLRHRLAVIAFADEEGAGFGVGTLSSRALVGEVSRDRFPLFRDPAGRSLADHLSARTHGLPDAAVPRRVLAYVELHAEQGPVLERMGRIVAAVDGIVGILRTTITFTGQAQHAGTTPMDARTDALAGAAEMVLVVRDLARSTSGRAVGTTGRLKVSPGAINVIPGRAALGMEMRSAEPGLLEDLRRQAETRAAEIADRHGLVVEIAPWDGSAPQPLDAGIRQATLGTMAGLGYEEAVLTSWAGHDAGVLARYVPSGMIFVPSTGGISHSPKEHTPWPAVEAGTQVLLDTLLALDATDAEGGVLPLAYTGR